MNKVQPMILTTKRGLLRIFMKKKGMSEKHFCM